MVICSSCHEENPTPIEITAVAATATHVASAAAASAAAASAAAAAAAGYNSKPLSFMPFYWAARQQQQHNQ